MKEGGVCHQMKTRKLCVVFGCIVLSSTVVWLFSSPPLTQDEAASHTHKNVRNVDHNPQNDPEVTVNPLYLSRLGLAEELSGESAARGREKVTLISRGGSAYPQQPVIATSFSGSDWENVRVFVQSAARFMSGYHLVVVDLTSSEQVPDMLLTYCNSTHNCEIRKFDFEKYPSHVADISIRSYRPICIQELLRAYGSVMWADSGLYFRTGNVSWALDQARRAGLVAWSIAHPTSAITHPSLFPFLHTRQDLYFFHRAVESSPLVLVDSPFVREKIMLPWVKCALQEDCISPRGAQHSGCNFMRKPLFKYSGCHFYDMAALNVILGPVFDFDERPYAGREMIFGSLVDDRLAAGNSSNPLHQSRWTVRDHVSGQNGEVVAS